MHKYKSCKSGVEGSLHSPIKGIMLLGIGVAAFLVAPSFGQNYLPAPRGKASLTGRNWLLPAQRSDLKMTFEHSFQTDPCLFPAEEEIIKTCTMTVRLQWLNDGRWNQGESDDDLGDPDDFVFYWEGFGHWSLTTATRDGQSVLGGATPEGSSFGNGTIDGLTMTVPSSFESGKSGATTYKFVLEYVPSSECEVRPLKVSGHYIHKYEGSLNIRVKPSLSVSAGVGTSGPSLGASISASAEWWFAKHAWQKQLFNPGGTNHKNKLEVDSNVVAHQECCGTTYGQSSSTSTIDMWVTDVSPAKSTTVQTVVYPGYDPIQSVSVEAWTEEDIQVGQMYYEPAEPTWNSIVLDLTALVPAGSDPGTLHFVGVARDTNLTQSEVMISSDSGGAPGPVFSGDLVKDERIVAPGDLLLIVDLDGREPQDVLDSNPVSVVDQLGNIVDKETAYYYEETSDGLVLFFPLTKSSSRTYSNGVLEVLNHDTVQSFSEYPYDPESVLLPVLTEDAESPFNIFAAEGPEFETLSFSGQAIGGQYMFDIGMTSGPVVIDTMPLESGQSIAQRLAAAINGAGMGEITAMLTETYDVVLGGDSPKFHVLQVDGSIDVGLLSDIEPPVTGDINGDGYVDGMDLALILGAWGSCTEMDGCPEDLDGDWIINGVDLAIVLGSWG